MSKPEKNLGVEIGSILIFTIGIFIALSLFSYEAGDPSFLSSASHIPKNACGRVGAALASGLLSFIGLAAFLVPIAFFVLSGVLHRHANLVQLAEALGGMALSTISIAVFLSLHSKSWFFGGSRLARGGFFGLWVADGLVRQLNVVGSSIIVGVVFYISLVVFTPFSVLTWVLQLVHFVKVSFKFLLIQGLLRRTESILSILRGRPTAILDSLLRNPLARFRSPGIPPSELSNQSLNFLASAALGSTANHLNSFLETNSELRLDSRSELSLDRRSELRPEGRLEGKLEGKPETGITILPREISQSVQHKPTPKAPRVTTKSKQGEWVLPPVEFLRDPPHVESPVDRERLISHSRILKQKFADFGIDGEVTAVRPGPVITLYEFKPGPGVKVSRIAALTDDLSMALSAQSVRILAPLPGKSVVGIEIPSETREMVYLREFLQHPDFYGPKHTIPVIMGKEIGGQTYLSDLARMPHLLCAGQTGSGKSVFMNGLICSLFYRFTPDELRMILVDPKFIEFRAYQEIPHLLLPVVDDPKQASIALRWAVREMERRYRILAQLGCRNLPAFNQKVEELGIDAVTDLLMAEEKGDWIEAFEVDDMGRACVGKLPYIVVIIDELADLMMVSKKEVEISIARIAQKARAAGIHLVIATQRPSTDVITGLIKANLPSRVSFQLASYVDSKTILDRAGAERLLGQGDMLFIPPGVSQNLRLHGAFLDDEEIEKITTFLKGQGKPAYRDEILLSEEDDEASSEGGSSGEDDELFQDAIHLVKSSGHASASFLQRNLKVGYNRAARMIETMESRGIVGPQDGARPREVLVRDV